MTVSVLPISFVPVTDAWTRDSSGMASTPRSDEMPGTRATARDPFTSTTITSPSPRCAMNSRWRAGS